MPPAHLDLAVAAVGVVAALVLAGVGIARLLGIALALRERLEGYADLPLRAYVERTTRKLDASSRSADSAATLAYRTRASIRELALARAKVVAVATNPSALWRLGTLVVTGR